MMLWQFSESSQALLNRCIEASNHEDSNKWAERFGHLNNINTKNVTENNTAQEIQTKKIENSSSVSSQATVIIEKNDISEDALREIVEQDPVVYFDYIVENCFKNTLLYSILAKNLPLPSIEKLFYHVTESKDTNSTFYENFYVLFLPTFFKRDTTRLSFDMLIKAEKCNSMLFTMLLNVIIKDVEIPKQILQRYISTLDNKKQIEILNNIVSDITNEAFIYHLYTIHMLYKNCEPTDDIQKYILNKFLDISVQCVNDKNYGRFLLTFLQNYKKNDLNFDDIQKLIDTHRSPFKKPCINAFNELIKLRESKMEID